MTVHDRDPVLRRKLTPRMPPPAAESDSASGPAQGLARAFGRAISAAAPLVAEEPERQLRQATLPELLDSIDPEAFVTLLGPSPSGTALALVDQPGFATIIEALTIGRLGTRPPGPRRATPTDAALLTDVLNAAFAALGAEDPVGLLRCTRPVPDHRLLPILLEDVSYDLVALTATLVAGAVARPLRLMLALPRAEIVADLAEETPAEKGKAWSEALEEAVMRAPASLRAELGRVTMPLAEVLELGVGGALILPLSNLEEVRLVALDGTPQAIGRLGQSRGMRAIRLTGWPGGMPAQTMIDASPMRAANPLGLAFGEGDET